MSRYILDDFTGAKIAITNTLDKQFGDLELIGTLMEYKHLQKDYWEGVGVGGSIATAAAFWEDRIFFGACDKNFYCLDRNGKELWRFRTEGVIQCEAGVHDGLVFFGSQDRNVYAADCLTGELKWKFPTNGFVIGYVLVHKGIVYAVSYDGNVYALEEKTGMELWRVTTHWAQTCIFEKDDILYFGYRGGVFYAYDINARKFLWTFKAGQREISIWNGCFWGNNVYFGCFDGNIFALDRKTGNLIWKFSVTDFAYAPSAGKDSIYFGSRDHNVYSLDAGTGKFKWKFNTGGMIAVPIEWNGKVYFGSYNNNVYCLDSATGKEIWSFKTNGFVTFVRVSEGRVHAGSWDCRMYCLDANTGALIWKFKTSMSTPAILEPPEQTASGTAEVVWHVAEEETKEKKGGEIQFSDYAETKSEYAGAGMGDYLGKKKRGYV